MALNGSSIGSLEDQALYSETPLMVLRLNTLEILGNHFNSKKLIPSTSGLCRDWRGLASAADLNFEDTNRLESNSNPTKQIILIWCRKTDRSTSRKISVQNFFDCVANKLDRSDVVDDQKVKDLIRSDCLAAKDRLGDISRERIDHVNPEQALTLNDVGVLANGDVLTTYDTMVLHGDAIEDQLFADDIIDRLEKVHLKVFVPERDLVAGTVEHAASCTIIQERCKKVIAIFSPSFFQSQENKFLTDFAQFVGIQQGLSCKIIPIILSPETHCEIPPQFKMYAKLAYKPHSKMFNFWDRLICKTMEVKEPLDRELMEYKDYSANRPRPEENKLSDNTSFASNKTPNLSTIADLSTTSSTVNDYSVNTQTTLVSNIETRSARNLVGCTNSQNNIEEDLTLTDASLPDFSTTNSVANLVDHLPNPPSHEPGETSKKKEKGKKGRIGNLLNKGMKRIQLKK